MRPSLDTVERSKPRLKVTDDEFGGFRITIVRPTSSGLIACLVLATFMWLALGCIGVCGFVGAPPRPEGAILGVIVWLLLGVLFFFGGVAAVKDRQEVILVADERLEIRSEWGPFRDVRTFKLGKLRNFRYQVALSAVEFRVGNGLNYFGSGLTEADCLRVIKTLKTRFKFPDDLDNAEPLPIERN